MSQSPDTEEAKSSDQWWQARIDLAEMMKRGRSFSGNERNCCFLNTGQARFATVSAASGLDFPDDARALAIVDWDQDGDLDLWFSNRNAPRLRLMQNNAQSENHYLAFRLVGNGTTTNRDAIGARVEVVLDSPESRRMIKTLHAGEGFLSQSSKWLHFGLGKEEAISKVTVQWPGGELEEFTGIEVDRRYRLQQATSNPVVVESSHKQLAIKPSVAQPLKPSRVARVPLVTLLPMPSLSYEDFNGKKQTLSFDSGKPVLVNLWASWCRPCVAELREIAERESEFRAAGIETVALSVDGLGEDKTAPESAPQLLERLKFNFTAGRANPKLLDTLQRLHNDLLVMWRPLPVPTSFLIDAKGRLSVIYKGPVSVDQLLQDVQPPADSYVERWRRAASLPGLALDSARVAQTALEAETRTRYKIAYTQLASNQLDDAIRSFEALLQRDPNRAEALAQLAFIYLRKNNYEKAGINGRKALQIDDNNEATHNTLGLVCVAQKRPADAKSHYLQAIEIRPDYAIAHNNLGTLLASQGDLEQAEKYFSLAVEHDADFAEAHTNLGSIFAARQDLKMAEKHYREAIRLDSNYAEAYNNLGSVLARGGNLKEAIVQFQRALTINPNYPGVRRNLQRAQSQLQLQQN